MAALVHKCNILWALLDLATIIVLGLFALGALLAAFLVFVASARSRS